MAWYEYLPVIGQIATAAAGVGAQYYTAEKNYAAQKANLDWQKYAQRNTWLREDNAIQRRVTDLQRAGLSKVLAAGQPAQASAPVKTEAPQIADLGQPLLNFLASLQAIRSIDKTIQETDLIKLQQEKVKEDTLNAITNRANTNVKTRTDLHNLQIYKSWKLPTNVHGWSQTIPSMFQIKSALTDRISNYLNEGANRLKNRAMKADKFIKNARRNIIDWFNVPTIDRYKTKKKKKRK